MPPPSRSTTPQPEPEHLQAGQGRRAARQATGHNTIRVTAPIIGTIELSPTDELAFLGGLGLLAVVGILEWPIAATLGIGHLFAANRRNKVMHDFGAALEEA